MEKKLYFIIGIITIIIMVIPTCCYIYRIKNPKLYTNNDFDIETYQSQIDKDEDGIDDQTDILENVKSYINSKPKYKSKYYNSGYPDDEFGVCTDVVAFGLLGAGYDIKNLLNEHIKNNKELYSLEVIDKNIDFRRVNNLKIYFENTAISLTTNPQQIEKWQGGDIVVFERHIGIISDKRNKKGITYVIHHANPYQISYEEDILESRNIIGHYRIS